MEKLNREVQAILVIAFRDFTKQLRDRPRILISLIFPFIFIGALGGMLQASIGNRFEYNWIHFVFTGVFAQTLFQSAAANPTKSSVSTERIVNGTPKTKPKINTPKI